MRFWIHNSFEGLGEPTPDGRGADLERGYECTDSVSVAADRLVALRSRPSGSLGRLAIDKDFKVKCFDSRDPQKKSREIATAAGAEYQRIGNHEAVPA
jgi:hypothetical protein